MNAIIFPRPFDSGQPTYSATRIQTERGDLSQINSASGTASVLATKIALDEVPSLRKLDAVLNEATGKIATIADETIPAKVPEKLFPVIRDIGPAFRDARFAVVKHAEKLALDDASRESLQTNYDHGLASHALAEWRALEISQKFDAIKTWPDYAIEAVKRAGQPLSGLSVDEWKLVLRRVRTINEIRRIKDTNPNFAKTPTADNPAARGFDDEKVEQFITDLDRIHARRNDAIKSAEIMLRDTIVFCAVAIGKSTFEAFEILNGSQNA